jgi:iron-sulfur cluster repair protein YtfE (RIC family)
VTNQWASFRDEHSRLRAGVERLRTVGDDVGRLGVAALRHEVEDVYRFLSHRLLAHIAVEEEILCPAIARLDGYGVAAKIMSRDHAEVSDAVRELYALRRKLESDVFDETEATALRRVLYGLYQLLRVHMSNEEEICLPALDRALSEGQVRTLAAEIELFDASQQAAE